MPVTMSLAPHHQKPKKADTLNRLRYPALLLPLVPSAVLQPTPPPHKTAGPDSINSTVLCATHSNDSSYNTEHTFAASNNDDTNRALSSFTVSMGGGDDATTAHLSGGAAGLFWGAGDRLSVYSSVGSCSIGNVISAGATGNVSNKALDKASLAGSVAYGTAVGIFGCYGSVRKGKHSSRGVRNSRKGARSNRRKGLTKAYFTTGAGIVRTPNQLQGSKASAMCAGQESVSTGAWGGASIQEQAAGHVDSVPTGDAGIGVSVAVDSELTGSVGSATAHAAHGLALLQFAAHSGAGSIDLVRTDSDELADTACSALCLLHAALSWALLVALVGV